MRHIKKITLAALLVVQVSSSPVQGMGYLSTVWNATKNVITTAPVRSLLSKIPGVQSVASKIFNGASNAVSSYTNFELGSFSPHHVILGQLVPSVLYGLRNPMCRLLSRATQNRLSPEFFNKLLIATTTPITLAIHAYCLGYMVTTIPAWDLFHLWNLWLHFRNSDLLSRDAAALLSINSLPLPPEPTVNDYCQIFLDMVIALENHYLSLSPQNTRGINFARFLTNAYLNVSSFLRAHYYYRNMGIISASAACSTIQDKINTGIRTIKRYCTRRLRHQNIQINDLDENHTSCAICQEDFAAGEAGSKLACNHHFHKDCLDPWLNNNALRPTCPTCRAEAPDNTITPVTFR